MKKGKILLVTVLSIGILTGGIISVSALSSAKTKAEILSELTNKTVEQITIERYDGNKTYGKIANESGVLEEFKIENSENAKVILQEKVDNGTLTQEKADIIILNMEKRQSNCDGTGNGNESQGLIRD